MVFDEFMRDKVAIVKPDGQKLDNVPASVSSKGITTFDQRLISGELAVEEGDVVLRELPNGLTERYLIMETGYMPEFQGIDAHYSMKVRKETAISKEKASFVGNVFNLTGSNVRVNLNSTDNSVNLMKSQNEAVFTDLRQAILGGVEGELQAKLLAGVTELEKAHQTPNFNVRFQEFMTVAANAITVVGPFLPALSKMLSG